MHDDPVAAIQRGLEALYRVESQLDVRDFLLTTAQRDALWPEGRRPHEQLFVRCSAPDDKDDDGVELALYLDEEVQATLRRHDPRRGVDDHNLGALVLALEGISHFIYTAVRARAGRPVSALELELQAEVDKYVALWLSLLSPGSLSALRPQNHTDHTDHTDDLPTWLIDRLYRRVAFDPHLSDEESDRYRHANHAAARYARALRQRHLRPAHRSRGPGASGLDLPGLLHDVRHFYRLSCADKLAHIALRS